MPKLDAEIARRAALVNAAAQMIGERCSLDVTVKDIAQRAGMSSALAFHYFGDKDEIVTETMRHLLRILGKDATDRLRQAKSPAEKLDAVILASFAPTQFEQNSVAAWLVFYLQAFSAPGPARLLSIYTRRLRSNLLCPLGQLVDRQRAEIVAEGLAAMIDGLYIRQGLNLNGPDAGVAIKLCRDYLDIQLNLTNHGDQS